MDRSWFRNWKRSLGWLLALGGGVAACGDDDAPADTGPAPMVDGGRDGGRDGGGGGPEGGTDGGGGGSEGGMDDAMMAGDGMMMMTEGGMPPTTAFVRAAHLISDGPAVRICALPLAGGMVLPAPVAPRPTAPAMPIPFRGVSGYIPFPTTVGMGTAVGYRIAVYDAMALDTWTAANGGNCPGPTAMNMPPTPVITMDAPAGLLAAGEFYTVAAVGFATMSAPYCTPPAFTTACANDAALQPHLLVVQDDHDAPAAGMVRVRVINGLANSPAPMSLCHDPDGPTMPMMPTLVSAGHAYNAMMPTYADTMPLATGFLGIYVPMDMTTPCGTLVGGLPLPAPAAISMIPGAADRLNADATLTLFMMGRIDPAAAMMAMPPAHVPTVIPIMDEPPAMM